MGLLKIIFIELCPYSTLRKLTKRFSQRLKAIPLGVKLGLVSDVFVFRRFRTYKESKTQISS